MARPAPQLRQDRAQTGIAMMLAAYLLFSFIDVSVKWLVLAGLPAMQLAFMRYVGHFAISLVLVSRNGLRWESFATKQFGLVVLRAALLTSATALNFWILKYVSLSVTSAIMFSAPIIVCALSMPLLGERVGPWRWFAICLGFCGVLVVVRPFAAEIHWAAILTIYNAFALALYSIITRKLSGEVAAETMQFWMGALGTLVLLPFAVALWQSPETPRNWALMIALGLWGWAGHELLTRAHGFAAAGTLMPYTYSFMIYMTAGSFLVFGDVPDALTLIGAAVIVASGLIIWWRERQREPKALFDQA